jgi:hypothetical protein
MQHGNLWPGDKLQINRFGEASERFYVMKVNDINNDGVPDIVGIRMSTQQSVVSPESDIRIYLGKKTERDGHSTFYLNPVPDQVIETDGNQLVLDVIDLNQDGRYDLVVPVVKVGLMNIIRMMLSKMIDVEIQTYFMKGDNTYPDKPDQTSKITMPFSFKGGRISPVYEIADFNGDGKLDILSSLEERQLVFVWGNEKGVMSSSINAKYNIRLPRDGELVQSAELNGDGKCDIIINYGTDGIPHADSRLGVTQVEDPAFDGLQAPILVGSAGRPVKLHFLNISKIY